MRVYELHESRFERAYGAVTISINYSPLMSLIPELLNKQQ